MASDLVSPQVSGGKWWGGSLLTYLRHGGGSARPRSSSSTQTGSSRGVREPEVDLWTLWDGGGEYVVDEVFFESR